MVAIKWLLLGPAAAQGGDRNTDLCRHLID
jgi:hypothetical protein